MVKPIGAFQNETPTQANGANTEPIYESKRFARSESYQELREIFEINALPANLIIDTIV